MQYVISTPNPSGAYPGPQSNSFSGCLSLTDEQAEMLVQYNGFVTITQEPDEKIEGSSVTVTPNLEALEEWKESLPPEPEPEPEPTLDERVTSLEANNATKDDVQAVWDQMAAAYNEGVQEA